MHAVVGADAPGERRRTADPPEAEVVVGGGGLRREHLDLVALGQSALTSWAA